MKPEEINKAIAEACGWREVEIFEWENHNRKPKQYHVTGAMLPNFSGSLDAMAEARKTLKPAERFSYCSYLWAMMDEEDQNVGKFNDFWLIANATPAQHAEAFLRAKGLCKESTP